MKDSTAKLLRLVERFYTTAAKLQLMDNFDPALPKDPNITGLSGQPSYKAEPAEITDVPGVSSKDLSSGVLPKSKTNELYTYPALIGRMADRLALETRKFYSNLLGWAMNPYNEHKERLSHYRDALNIISSLIALAEDIAAESHFGIKEERGKQFVSYLEKIIKYLAENTALFSGIQRPLHVVYEAAHHLTRILAQSVGSMSELDATPAEIYDLAVGGKGEDSGEDLVDEDPVETQTLPVAVKL